MKKSLLLLMILFYAAVSWAAKAWTEPLTVKQIDGTTLTTYVHGDEHFNWYSTTDGVILYREDYTFYIANIHEDGTISSTGQLAHEKADRNFVELNLIALQNKELFFAKAEESQMVAFTRSGEPIASNSTLFPHTGTPKAIVILANYADTTFTLPNPRKSFVQFLNGFGSPTDFGNGEGRNYSSVQQYFKDMSFGKFVPQFDVYGPVTLPQPLAYYGGTDNEGHDEKFSELISDACRLMDDSLNFADYDSNGDGLVDLVYVVYAGYGQNMGAPVNTMWPKAGTITSAYQTADNVKVYRSGISNELIGNLKSPISKRISGVGLFCHEFSHCLGLPDFYPTIKSARVDNQGMEAWSMMDDGEYTAMGYCPTAYTAWERETMGWLEIETLQTPQQIKLENIDYGGKAYRILNDADTSGKEYYIVQNIQQKKWNQKLNGHGMLVYHISYDSQAYNLSYNTVNNVLGKPKMTVIPADNKLLSSWTISDRTVYNANFPGDPFPGVNGVTTLNDSLNLVNYAPWTGGELAKPIYNINELGDVVYFDFLNRIATTGIEKPIQATETITDRRIFSLDGQFLGTDLTSLPKGIYIQNKKKIVKM